MIEKVLAKLACGKEEVRAEVNRILSITCLTGDEPDTDDQILALLQAQVEEAKKHIGKRLMRIWEQEENRTTDMNYLIKLLLGGVE